MTQSATRSPVDAFIGGDKVRPTADPNYSTKDFQLFANQFIGDAAVSAHWYHGTATTPFTPDGGTTFLPLTNRFDRAPLYGTLPVNRMLWLLGGAQWGWDRRVDTAGTIPLEAVHVRGLVRCPLERVRRGARSV